LCIIEEVDSARPMPVNAGTGVAAGEAGKIVQKRTGPVRAANYRKELGKIELDLTGWPRGFFFIDAGT
jgi:hypothetical protein